jgi:hypothetical protein
MASSPYSDSVLVIPCMDRFGAVEKSVAAVVREAMVVEGHMCKERFPMHVAWLLRGFLIAFAMLMMANFRSLPVDAQADTATTNISVSVSGTLTLACLGEDVTFSGTIFGVEHLTRDAAGREHSVGHAGHLQATGIGLTSGASYILRGGVQDTAGVFAADGQTAITTIFSGQYVSKGGGPNYHLVAQIHLTRNANGDVVLALDRIVSERCG